MSSLTALPSHCGAGKVSESVDVQGEGAFDPCSEERSGKVHKDLGPSRVRAGPTSGGKMGEHLCLRRRHLTMKR